MTVNNFNYALQDLRFRVGRIAPSSGRLYGRRQAEPAAKAMAKPGLPAAPNPAQVPAPSAASLKLMLCRAALRQIEDNLPAPFAEYAAN